MREWIRLVGVGVVCLSMVVGCSQPPEAASTWLHENGEPADRGPREFEVRALRGAEHCDWQAVVFLTVAWPLGTTYVAGPDAPQTRQYVRDPDNVLGMADSIGRVDLDAELPASAERTGYRTSQDAELWLADDAEDFVYVVMGDHAERWPRAPEPIACA